MIRETQVVYLGKTLSGDTVVEGTISNDGQLPVVSITITHPGHTTILSIGYHSAGQLGEMLKAASEAARVAPKLRDSERCLTCGRSDREYRRAGFHCVDPWHSDMHLRARSLALSATEGRSDG